MDCDADQAWTEMLIMHGRESWSGEPDGGLVGSEFRLAQQVSGQNWGLPYAQRTFSPCERFPFWYSICPQAGVQNFRQHLYSMLSGCPLSALKTGE